MVDYQSADHEQLMKRLRPAQSVEEVILKSCYLLQLFSWLTVMCVVVVLLNNSPGTPLFKLTVKLVLMRLSLLRLRIQRFVNIPIGQWMTCQEQ